MTYLLSQARLRGHTAEELEMPLNDAPLCRVVDIQSPLPALEGAAEQSTVAPPEHVEVAV